MRNWLRNYEDRRLKEPNESWGNSRYGPQNMSWSEAREIYLPSVKMKLNLAWNRLRKLWRSYNISGANGESRIQTAYEINRYQAALDLPRTPFEELEGVVSDYEFEQETPEEWPINSQLLREEAAEGESPMVETAEAEEDDSWDFDEWKRGDDW